MKLSLRRFIAVLLFGVLVYGVFVAVSGYRALGSALGSYHWLAFGAALALSSLNYLLRFAKWEYYLARLQVRGVPKWDSFLVFLSGFSLTVTPGKVGEVFKSAVLHETHGVAMARTAPIVIAERLTDVIAIVVLIVAGSAGFQGGLPWAAAGAFCVTLGVICIAWRAPLDWLVHFMERRPGALERLAPKARQAVDSLRVLASPSALLWPSFLSVVGWGLEGFSLWLIIGGFDFQVPVMLAVFFYATATLAGALIPVPGGLGVAETLLLSQLVQLGGTPEAVATGSMLMIRFSTLWWAVLVGFTALALLRRRFPSLLRESKGELASRAVSS